MRSALVRKALLALGMLAGMAAAAHADNPQQSHDSILEAAREHVLQRSEQFPGQVSVKPSPLDRRLRLAECDIPLQTYESPNGLRAGRSVVGVRCDGNKPWKVYVPVHIATLDQVVISTRALARGQLVGKDDLTITEQDTARLHKGYFTDASRLIGQRAKRAISGGRVITPAMLAQNQVVRRGGQVEILAQGGGLAVRMRGKALGNAGVGERIRVKNLSSGREVTGTVVEAGVVLVQQ